VGEPVGPGSSDALGTLIADGRQAEVFLRTDGTVLKLFRAAGEAPAAAREADVLSALPALGVRAPRLVAQVTVDGRPGIVMERVDAPDWLRVLGQRPWVAATIGRALAVTHRAIHEVRAPAGLPTVHERLRSRLRESHDLDGSTRAAALRLVDALAIDTSLAHGDFHLENLLGPFDAATVIDWSNAAAGPPAADVARTMTVLRFGEPPAGAPVIVRRLAPVARRHILRQYAAAYDRASPGRLATCRQWQLVQAAARVGETTATEAVTIRAWLRRHLVD
jgi:aminoglycoside phosphotransferase (APT) family kinase protein